MCVRISVCMRIGVRACLLSRSSHVQLCTAPWTVALHAPLSMGSSSQESWSGFPCPSLGDLPNSGIKPMYLTSPALAGRSSAAHAAQEACIAVDAHMYSLVLYMERAWNHSSEHIQLSKGTS